MMCKQCDISVTNKEVVVTCYSICRGACVDCVMKTGNSIKKKSVQPLINLQKYIILS